jgi:hypothetical protein
MRITNMGKSDNRQALRGYKKIIRMNNASFKYWRVHMMGLELTTKIRFESSIRTTFTTKLIKTLSIIWECF